MWGHGLVSDEHDAHVLDNSQLQTRRVLLEGFSGYRKKVIHVSKKTYVDVVVAWDNVPICEVLDFRGRNWRKNEKGCPRIEPGLTSYDPYPMIQVWIVFDVPDRQSRYVRQSARV